MEMLEAEDSLRRYLHREGAIQDHIDNYHYKVNNALLPDTSLIEQTLLVRFSRSDLSSPLRWENYNKVSIMYETPRTFEYDNKSDWQGVNVDYVRPGIRIILKNIAERRSLYTWERYRQSKYDSLFVPTDVRVDYLEANNISVILYKYLGYTSDQHEQWYAQSIVDSAVWNSFRRYQIKSNFQEMCNEAETMLRLYKSPMF